MTINATITGDVPEVPGDAAHIFIRPDLVPDATLIRTVRIGMGGGVIDFDISEAVPAPSIEVWDLDAAGWWLPAVCGAAVTESAFELRASMDGASEPPAIAGVPIDENAPLLPVMRRLTLALWLRRWRPLKFRDAYGTMTTDFVPWLLDVEAGSLAVDADIALSPDFPLAQALFRPHLHHLAAGVVDHNLRADAEGNDAQIDAVINLAADDAIEKVRDSVDGWDLLAQAIEARDQTEAAVAVLDEQLESFLASQQTNLAGVMAGATGNATIQTAPVDPRTVPARLVGTTDSAIQWQVSEDNGAWRVDVVVVASEIRASSVLYARIDFDGESSSAELQLSPQGYATTLWLQSDPGSRGLVTVYGGIPNADAMPNRSTDERKTDAKEILRLVDLRTQRRNAAQPDAWDTSFAAEIATVARVPVR